MRVPDYGRGDWKIKYERNRNLPYIKDIGLKDNTIYISVSAKADSIKVTGQGHTVLSLSQGCKDMEYTMTGSDNYARFTAYFPDGEVIYSNPFARYDASSASHPGSVPAPEADIILTILFNLLAALITGGCIYTLYKLIRS